MVQKHEVIRAVQQKHTTQIQIGKDLITMTGSFQKLVSKISLSSFENKKGSNASSSYFSPQPTTSRLLTPSFQ